MILRIRNVEMRKINVLVGFFAAERHDYINKNTDAMFMTRFYQCNKIGVGGWRCVPFRIFGLVVRGKEMRRVVTSFSFEKTVCRWQQFKSIYTEIAEIGFAWLQQI